MSKKNKILLLIFSAHLIIISIILGCLSIKSRDVKPQITSTDKITTSISTTKPKTTEPKQPTTKLVTTKPITTKHTTTKPKTTIVTTKKQQEVIESTTQTKTTTYQNNTYYTKSDIEMVARVLYAECRGVSSKTQKACVVWVICNRADSSNRTIRNVILSKNQFAYNKYSPIQNDLYAIASDVLSRWVREKNGETNVGRVLPKNYLYFHGDGKRNYFKTNYTQPCKIWDYSLPSPYSS